MSIASNFILEKILMIINIRNGKLIVHSLISFVIGSRHNLWKLMLSAMLSRDLRCGLVVPF